MLSLTSAVGRWDAAPSAAEAHKLSRQALRNLQRLGGSQEVIRAATALTSGMGMLEIPDAPVAMDPAAAPRPAADEHGPAQ